MHQPIWVYKPGFVTGLSVHHQPAIKTRVNWEHELVFIRHCPQPKFNQKSPKDPNLILILTMKLVYAYFSLMLPEGALIFVVKKLWRPVVVWWRKCQNSSIRGIMRQLYQLWACDVITCNDFAGWSDMKVWKVYWAKSKDIWKELFFAIHVQNDRFSPTTHPWNSWG